MEVEEYSGVLAEILEAIAERGENIRRIWVTKDEMQEIQFSNAWRQVVTKYYGDAKAVMHEIVTDRDGNFLSFYYENVLVVARPDVVPSNIDDLDFPVLELESKGTSIFHVVGSGGNLNMLVGTGNPADDFVYGLNDNIELGIAARIRGSRTYKGDGTNFNIALNDNENWVFAITVGSMQPEIPNITDMYNVELFLGHGNGEGQTWNLRWFDGMLNGVRVKNYLWYEGPTPVITDSATDPAFSVTQMIQRYDFNFIKNYLPADTEFNPAGSPLGSFELRLTATPRRKGFDPVSISTVVNVTKKD